MARKGLIEANKRRKRTVLHYAALRKDLKKKISDPSILQKERFELREKLQALPRDSSPVRVRSRCVITGRSRGVYSFCRLSRMKLREFASFGFLPGITRSSW